MNETTCQSCALSSVDVPCVKDVIFNFNAFDREYFCTLCLAVSLKRVEMCRSVCQEKCHGASSKSNKRS